jgi:hypothetical protein
MSYYDTSYPPSLYGLPSAHDLQLVGTVVPTTLTVNYTWDSDGKSATLGFGDGTHVTNSVGAASHTYGIAAVYLATVVSGNARDSAEITLTGATATETETEETPSEYAAVKVDELPITEEIPTTE